MPVYLVSFDLHEPERPEGETISSAQFKDLKRKRQEGVFRAIIGTGDWGRVSLNTYVVHTPDSVEQVFQAIQKAMSPEDSLYVLPLRRPFLGQGPAELSVWLEEILPY